MAKLNISTTPKKQQPKKKKGLDKTYSDLTDKQLAAIVDEIDKEEYDEPEEIEETGVKIDGVPVKVDEIRTIEDFNFDKEIIKAFKETYPQKRILYRNKITNQFVDFYIDNCHSGVQLTNVRHNLLSDKQKQKFESEIDMISAVEEVNDGLIEKSKEQIYDGFIISENNIIIDPTEEQSKAYELILSEKWESREKGIIELDSIIRELIHTIEPTSLTEVLNDLIDKFGLTAKVMNKNKPKENKKKNFIKPRDLSKAIIYFNHIEFLFKLLDDENTFELKREFTEEENEHIQQIYGIVEGHKHG